MIEALARGAFIFSFVKMIIFRILLLKYKIILMSQFRNNKHVNLFKVKLKFVEYQVS